MKATIEYNSRKIQIDVSKPIDISIAIDPQKQAVNAWYIEDPKIFPQEFDGEKILVSEGAVVISTISISIHMLTLRIQNVWVISPKKFTL